MHRHTNPSRKPVTSKPHSVAMRPFLPPVATEARFATREGSVLIVVIGMLLLLMLIGFTFFTFSSQEQSSAEYYADAAKVYSPADPNILFDWALEQLIIGPHDVNTQSVLWPGKHSLVPNMLGMFTYNQNGGIGSDQPTQPTDRHSYNGGWGINVISGPQGQPYIDQNFDGQNDQNNVYPLLAINWSPAATGPAGYNNVNNRQGFLQQIANGNIPQIDVGYTYSDINNVFLAHVGNAPQSSLPLNNGNYVAPLFVATPSFHRPQYLRDINSGVPLSNWYSSPATVTQVMRPHPSHVIVGQNGVPLLGVQGNNAPTARFLNFAPTVAGSNPPHTIQPFPFAVDANNNGIFNEEGVWSNSSPMFLDYDVDNDGDTIREGIWLDLNFPPTILPDGRIMVPLFSYTVVEADSLINLNQAGNISGFLTLSLPVSGPPLTNMQNAGAQAFPISRSNLGISATEINPFWALVCDPQNSTVFVPSLAASMQQYRGFYGMGIPASTNVERIGLSNMDMLSLFWGRPKYTVTLDNQGNEQFALADINAGLWGEPVVVPNSPSNNSLMAGLNGNGVATTPANFPRPGWSGTDDDGDQYAGGTDHGDMSIYQWPLPVQGFPTTAIGAALYPTVPPLSQPLDYTGYGQWLMIPNGTNTGLTPNFVNPFPTTTPQSPARFLEYNYYQQQFYGLQPPAPNFPTYNPNALYSSGVYQQVMQGNYLSQNTYDLWNDNTLIDEGDEVIPDRRYRHSGDQIFTPDETAALQVSPLDMGTALGQSRLVQLVSLNFNLNNQAALIRQRFTTESWDRRQNGFAYNPNRSWEYGVTGSGNQWDNSGGNQFPPRSLATPASFDGLVPSTTNTPTSGQAEPFRMELAALIGARLNNSPFAASFPNQFAFKTPAYDKSFAQNRMSPWQQQLRLNINRFISVGNDALPFGVQSSPNQGGQNNPLFYRQLTPHPTMQQWTNGSGSGATSIANRANSSGSFHTDAQSFSSNPALQEYWARRDRQQMARDIYVMLYMFGGGTDNQPYATTANTITSSGPPVIRVIYSNYQLAEMAQFAVNTVDALDRDDTITVFEYDRDLSNGWNLDDNPFTSNDSIGPLDRGVVYGVEAQQLAFSEALVVVSRKVLNKITSVGMDHGATQFDDSQMDRTFTYLELYNVSPFPVSLANMNWQIVLLDPAIAASQPGQPVNPGPNTTNPMWSVNPTQTVYVPAQAAGTALTALTLADNTFNGTVNPGQPYTIGSRTYIVGRDDLFGAVQPSYFLVDPMWTNGTPIPDPAFQTSPQTTRIAPAYNAALSLPYLNLDLVKQASQTGGAQPFVLTDFQYQPLTANFVQSPIGEFCDMTVNATKPGDCTTSTFALISPPYLTATFALRRRLNMNRPAPQIGNGQYNANDDADNPFVEVDRIAYQNINSAGNLATDPISGPIPSPSVQPAYGYLFNLRDPNDPANLGNPAVNDIQPKLKRTVGRERRQPLDGYDGTNTVLADNFPPGMTNNNTSHLSYYPNFNFPNMFAMNTLGTTNYQTTTAQPTIGSTLNGAFTLWQPHFDRDFASVMDLLSIPLYGPSSLTGCLAPQDMAHININTLAHSVPLVPTAGNIYQPLIAQAKILYPQHPQNVGLPPGGGNSQIDNRWHRVFELLEVQTRQNMQVENYLVSQYPWFGPQAEQRVAAKMNLNGTRYGENLFALLDDPNTFNVFGYSSPFSSPVGDGSYQDFLEFPGNPSSPTRNWWFEMVKARDGYDPQATLHNLDANSKYIPTYLPGSPAAQPFRSFDSIERPNDYNPATNYNFPPNSLSTFNPAPSTNPVVTSLEDTLLRTLPLDNGLLSTAKGQTLEARGLFEARTQNDLASQQGNSSNSNRVDYYTRQRLLSKISGNTTPRSNVFLVWVTVGFFEGYQPDSVNFPTAIQVGAEMTDQTRRRGFFVVDRSLLEDAWIAPQYDVNNNLLPNTGIYDFKKFVQYRKTVQ